MNWQVQCSVCETLLRLPELLIQELDELRGIEDLKLGDIRAIRCPLCGKPLEICLDPDNQERLVVSRVLTEEEAEQSERSIRLFTKMMGGVFLGLCAMLIYTAYSSSNLWARAVCVGLGIVIGLLSAVVLWVPLAPTVQVAEEAGTGGPVQ